MFPSIDIGLNSQRSIIRNFEDRGIDNIVERSRAAGRNDLTVSLNQPVYDFGATEARIAAAGARLRAAAADAELQADQVALRAIAAWYDVFAYRALVTLGSAFSGNQAELRDAIQTRIDQGVSAPGDLPRVESYIASAQADLARYRRQLANAEARFQEMFGVPAPPDIGRAPIIAGPTMTKDMAQFLARSAPEVQGAEALARAARQDARAARAQTLPSVSAGIDAGQYGLIATDDYDVRGRITVRHRLFGGIDARADQARARADAADARASRTRSEAEREAAIAWSDVAALEQQLAALQNSYIASRQSRDVLAERFRVARGTLFDLLESESGYFNVSATYIRAITELDASRYVLLSRTGRLLPTLDIEPPAMEVR
jgi:adhesin transport system outer membrane protein